MTGLRINFTSTPHLFTCSYFACSHTLYRRPVCWGCWRIVAGLRARGEPKWSMARKGCESAARQSLASRDRRRQVRRSGLEFFPKQNCKARMPRQLPRNVWFGGSVPFWNKSRKGSLALTRGRGSESTAALIQSEDEYVAENCNRLLPPQWQGSRRDAPSAPYPQLHFDGRGLGVD